MPAKPPQVSGSLTKQVTLVAQTEGSRVPALVPVLKIQRRNEGLWGLQKRLTLALGAQGRRLGMAETSAFLPVFLESGVIVTV